MFYITKNWYELLKDEWNKDYFKSLQDFLKQEYNERTIYPKAENVFNALNLIKYDDVKVVIIGQDPYINEGQAHGLCFSVEKVAPPPSLVNIYKELKTAGLSELAELKISVISGGEYKLLQVIRQMLKKPALLIMDEPDAFLDFSNLTGLKNLINSYQGTLLVITHNRYLLNHCFDKILHLEVLHKI